MKLIQTLKRVVEALEKGSIEHNWFQPSACNCGVIAQVILDLPPSKLDNVFRTEAAGLKRKDDKGCMTWKTVVQRTCTATGLTSSEIIKGLQKGGLRPEDAVHLEYMENHAILEGSGINVKEQDYYTKGKNLILYLRSWIKILEATKVKTHTKTDRRVDIEKSLLVAVANEDYEKAAELRDLLVVSLN